MLIALKIHSMRMADKRDIIMLCYKKPSIQSISNHLKNCPKQKIIVQINELLESLNDGNLKDSIKGVFSIDDKIYKKTIKNCLQIINDVIYQLQ